MSSSRAGNRWSLPTYGAIFVLSGVAALVYQVAWMRQLTLLFGATVYAVSTILACFMGGLAGGAWLGGKLAHRTDRPARTYGFLELMIAAWGAISIPMFDGLPLLVGALLPRELTGFPDIVLRFGLALPILLVPTALMGATLPVLIRQVAADDATAAGRAGLLYTANTLGAALGAALAGYLLVPSVGLKATVSIAALLNVAAGGLAVAVARGVRVEPPEELPVDSQPVPSGWLVVAFATGLAALAVEVLWTRALVLYLGSSVYAYASMLTVYLLGLAVGGGVGVGLLRTGVHPATGLALAQGLLALDLPLLVHQFGGLSERIVSIQQSLGSGTYVGFTVASFLAVAEVLLLPTLLMGISFPLLIAVVVGGAAGAPRRVGALYASNTIGAIVGSIAAPVVLIRYLGIQRSLVVAALLAVVISIGTVAHRRGALGRPSGAAALVVSVIGFLGLYNLTCPADAVILGAGVFDPDAKHRKVLAIEEDVDATISVEAYGFQDDKVKEGGWYSLSVNGVNVAGSAPDLVAIQVLQGHLPLLFAGDRGRVVHIGFGSGGTAHAVSRHPVEEIVVAELSLGVIRTSDRWFRVINHGVLQDPRLRVVHKDGRNYLLGQGDPFDVILSDSVHPRYSGNGALYSEEYYRRCRSQLKEGGVVSQWLPMYSMTPSNFRSILKAFTNVFPSTTVWYVNSTLNPFTIVIGHRDGFEVDFQELSRRMAEPPVATDLAEGVVPSPFHLLDYFVMGGEATRRFAEPAPSHRDDLPIIEYESMMVMQRDATWRILLDDIIRNREPVIPYVRNAGPEELEKLELFHRATSVSLGAHQAILAGRQDEALELIERARAMNPADPDPVAW